MFFGAGNNFILALVVLFFIGLFNGSPVTSTVIPKVIEGSPAAIGGLLPNDKVIAINGKSTKTIDDVQLYLAISKEETEFTVLRDGKEEKIKVTPLTEEEQQKLPEDNRYSYGIQFDNSVEHGFIPAIN